jgi:hypothetical protein
MNNANGEFDDERDHDVGCCCSGCWVVMRVLRRDGGDGTNKTLLAGTTVKATDPPTKRESRERLQSTPIMCEERSVIVIIILLPDNNQEIAAVIERERGSKKNHPTPRSFRCASSSSSLISSEPQ